MGSPVIKGRADYLALGDYNAACSMCGRKRKASTMERNWQGMYRCPTHNEPRQPQDFVRNVKDVMTVPWAQPETNLFAQINPTFPCLAQPNPVVCVYGTGLPMTNMLGEDMTTQGGVDMTTIAGYASPLVILVIPAWVTVESVQWSWLSGGANITIDSPNSIATFFSSLVPLSFGLAQAVVTNTLGGQATATVVVSVAAGVGVTGDTMPMLLLGMNL